jgi:hypothetical protein
MNLFIFIIVLLFLFGGGGWGYSRYGAVGLSPAALVLVLLAVLYFTGNLR